MTRIQKCTCTHKFQDKQYGKGKRVFNEKSEHGTYRCTICGRET